ncbi:alpha/beta hydrolase [Halorarum salinum]|uniref:Alpha/beta fold hydrolase n=1 Tax=Halorarum salinum TaxID=2743089 RepID=A0A7D5LC58_9EURY|nr:alpha/beta fold hydrolase [Halobaculum salinum]QLG63313.1 alpha/beta fold hydrolase [Halobaculum salinum]
MTRDHAGGGGSGRRAGGAGTRRGAGRGGSPSREAYATRRVTFRSDGDACAGTLYLPASADDAPVVVMAHGFAAEASFGLERYAERFAEAGYAALTFDYRGFDGSEGEAVVLPGRQLDDWHAALDRVDDLDEVGGSRALWGTSLSGGHVIRVAAERRDVDAVLAQAPFVDGRTLLRTKSKRYLLRAAGAGLRDRVGSLVGRPHHVKVFGAPDEFAALNEPGAKEGYLRLVPRESRWRNRTPARTLLALPRYRPVESAEDVRAPTLVVAGTADAVVPFSAVAGLVEALPDPTLVAKRMGHFDVHGDAFPELVDHQLAFLRATL